MRIFLSFALALLGLMLPQIAAAGVQILVRPSEPRQGQIVLVEVRGARAGERVSGNFLESPLRFYIDDSARVRALTAVPLSAQPGPQRVELKVQPAQGEPIYHHAELKVRAGDFDEQTLRVNPKFVKPPARFAQRIKRERAIMNALFEQPPQPRLWRGSFVWPRKDVICSAFGLHRVFNKESQSRHLGLDIDGRTGSPIKSIARGRVVMVSDRYYSGGTVVIDHGLRLFSMYFHLSSFSVEVGQVVSRGQLLGGVGRSGRATGPHLHITTKVEGIHFDPTQLFQMDLSEGEARR